MHSHIEETSALPTSPSSTRPDVTERLRQDCSRLPRWTPFAVLALWP